MQFRIGIDESTRQREREAVFTSSVYLPKQSRIAVRTSSADIDGTDVSGSFTSASGAIVLRGTSATLEIESMNGNIDVNANASWLRARTGQGRLLIRGAVQDVDASTVDGELDVATPAVMRGRFASVTGDIRYSADARARARYSISRITRRRRHGPSARRVGGVRPVERDG